MESNIAELCGIVMSELEFSHKTYGEVFYTFVLGVQRRSGYVDELNVMVSERLIYDKHVAVVPGTAFGESGEGFVRCSYDTATDKIVEAMARMGRFVERVRDHA